MLYLHSKTITKTIKNKIMRNLVNTLKNNDSTTNTGLAIVTLVIVPMLITIASNINPENLF